MILAESGKSREREGSALALKKPRFRFGFCLGSAGWRGLGAPALGAAFEDVAVMKEAVEHGADRRDIGEEFAPIIDGAIGGQ